MNKELSKIMYFSLAVSVGISFVTLFVNLYIWVENESFLDLALFNLSIYLVWPLFFTFGSYLMYKYSLRVTMRLGSVFFIVLFSVLAFVPMENKTILIIVAGILFSATKSTLGNGNTQGVAVLGSGKEIISFYQRLDFWGKTLNIITPILFAVILTFFGYKNIFILMLLFSVALFVSSNLLPDIKAGGEMEDRPMFKGFSPRKLYAEKHHRLLPLSYLTGGTFSEFQAIFLVFFTFSISSNQMLVALLNLLYTLLTLVSIKLYEKWNLKDETWLFIGIGFAFPGFILATILDNWWLILPNLLLVFGNFYYRTTFYAQHFQAIEDVQPFPKFQITIWRETLLSVARVMILLPILILYQYFDMEVENYMGILLLFVFLATFAVPFIHRSFILPEKKTASVE